MPFIRDVSANYQTERVMHAVIHAWYMSGLISRSVYIAIADSGPRGPLYIGLYCISNFMSEITYTFVKCGCSIYFLLNSAILICRGTDMSKYFRESLGIRDNESQLYFLKWIHLSRKHFAMFAGVDCL